MMRKTENWRDNLWQATAGAPIPEQVFQGHAQVDCVVIGGGITGATAALHLAQAGTKCALLEADTIGFGASSRPGGFVVPHFTFGSPSVIMEKYNVQGEWLVNAVGGSARLVFDLIQKFKIDCDARESGWYQPAHSIATLKQVEQTAHDWQKAGFRNELLDGTDTAIRTGVNGYLGSWYTPEGGTLHPQNYTLGLARTAQALGALIYQNSKVTAIERVAGKFTVKTDLGTLISDRVLVCTNGLSSGLSPELETTMLQVPVWQCATAPIPESQRSHLFKHGECLSDTRANLFTYRFDSDWRLITGALEPYGQSAQQIGRIMAQRLGKFLNLDYIPVIEYLWRGIASVTPSRLPEISVSNEGLISSCACNARGIALSTVFGKLMAEVCMKENIRDLPYRVQTPVSRLSIKTAQIAEGFYPYYASFRDWMDR